MKKRLLSIALLWSALCNAQELAKDTINVTNEALQEAVIRSSRNSRSIDKITYRFKDCQMNEADDGRELIATLPNLFIDKSTNNLSTINGKSILILINGIQATNDDLKLIPANKIKNVEIYDVPPMRYMDNAENVINIKTKPLDTGVQGNLYGTLGQMFSNTSAALSYNKNNSKFTFNYGSHFNMKRKITDLETGRYSYRIGNDDYEYDYSRENQSWGNQHSIGFSYLTSKESNYDLQIKLLAKTADEKLNACKSIGFSRNNFHEERTGELSNSTSSVVPTMDVYFSKTLPANNTLSLNVVYSYFDNKQQTHSTESGTTGFDDKMLIDNNKGTLMGELVYAHKFSKANLSFGYRGHYNHLSNSLTNFGGLQEESIITQKHRMYGEVSGRVKSFMYRASLGANCDIRSGEGGFRNFTFTPVFIAGYNINDASSLRLIYNSSTQMPNIQQMSDARIMIMNNFYQCGNKDLQNAHLQSLQLSYDLYLNKFSISAYLLYDHNRNSIFDSYQYGDDCILLQASNAEKDVRRGGGLYFDYAPWKYLRMGGSVDVYQQVFQPSADSEAFKYWSYPISLYISANYKNFTLDISQKFGDSFLSGLYKTGIEKVSYISLEYSYKRLNFGLQCYFPFIKDKYSNETIPGSIVYHKTDYHLRRKDKTLAFSVSWNFSYGKKNVSIRRSMDNYDNDSGLFEIK